MKKTKGTSRHIKLYLARAAFKLRSQCQIRSMEIDHAAINFDAVLWLIVWHCHCCGQNHPKLDTIITDSYKKKQHPTQQRR